MPLELILALAALLGSLTGVAALYSSISTRKQQISAVEEARERARELAIQAREELDKKVDAEAYKVAQEFYSDVLLRSRDEQNTLRLQLTEAQEELTRTKKRLFESELKSESERRFLQQQIAEQHLEIKQLKTLLREVGIPVDEADKLEP